MRSLYNHPAIKVRPGTRKKKKINRCIDIYDKICFTSKIKSHLIGQTMHSTSTSLTSVSCESPSKGLAEYFKADPIHVDPWHRWHIAARGLLIFKRDPETFSAWWHHRISEWMTKTNNKRGRYIYIAKVSFRQLSGFPWRFTHELSAVSALIKGQIRCLSYDA